MINKFNGDKEKHKQIQAILEELSLVDNVLCDLGKVTSFYDKFVGVYCKDDFRHLYSEIFAYLTLIDKKEETNLDVLSENIKHIYTCGAVGYGESDIECFKKIKKLYDHINLEISRMRSTRAIMELHEKDKNELSENIITTKIDIDKTKTKIQEISLKTEKIQREYITILGIFASIVLTFVAGMIFSSSVLENIHKVTIYRLSFVIILLGFVLINLLGTLMSFIAHISASYEYCKSTYIRNVNITLAFITLALLIAWIITTYVCKI